MSYQSPSKRQPPPAKYQFTAENQPLNRGRKPKTYLDDLLNSLLDEDDSLEKILRTHIKLAISGSHRSAEMILDRKFGKSKFVLDVQNEEPTKIQGLIYTDSNGQVFDFMGISEDGSPLSDEVKEIMKEVGRRGRERSALIEQQKEKAVC